MVWCLLSSFKVKVEQSCLTLCDPRDYTVHGILQAAILEWVAILFSRGSSQPRDRARVSCIAGRFFTSWAKREAHHLFKKYNKFSSLGVGNLLSLNCISIPLPHRILCQEKILLWLKIFHWLPIILLCYRNTNKGGNLKIISSGFSYHLNNNPHVIKANISTLL